MIGKKIENPEKSASKAVRVRRLANYILAPETEDAREKCIYFGARGFLTSGQESQIAELIALAHDAPRSRDPVDHFVLSWRKGEQTNRGTGRGGCGSRPPTSFRMRSHQLMYALHADTDNMHLHIVINRVHPESLKVEKINGGFDRKAIHRAVTRIEHAQGWRPEKNARYRVNEFGEVERSTSRQPKRAPQPTQQQIDQERRTGEQSAARTAIETAGPIIKQATSWEQLHMALAHKGMRYAKQGSGATVQVGDVHVKASTVSREATLKRIEDRLGSYRSAAECGLDRDKAGDEVEDDPTELRFRSNDPADALPFIETATSWEELHHDLGKRGIRYAKTGSGATIFAGCNDEFSMKASAVSRTVTLRKLEQRLGPFVPARSDREPAPKDMPRWNDYADAEEQYREEMRLAWEAFEKERQGEEERLQCVHREARAALLREQSWERRGRELRFRQSLLSLEHARERAALMDDLRRRREALRATYSPWPDFTDWVDDHQIAFLWRARFTAMFSIEAASPPAHDFKSKAKGDIRDYQARQVGDSALYTTAAHRRERRVAFVDRGKRITIHDWPNRSSTLAALQLATQKWDRIVVKGNASFKMECARLAAQHGFKVVNPELKDVIRKIRAERERRVKGLHHAGSRSTSLTDGRTDEGSGHRSHPTTPEEASGPSY